MLGQGGFGIVYLVHDLDVDDMLAVKTWVLREYTAGGEPTGRMLRWHPGGGRHGRDPYWRVVGYEGDLGGGNTMTPPVRIFGMLVRSLALLSSHSSLQIEYLEKLGVGDSADELALEFRDIDNFGGIGNLLNVRNPIGDVRVYLMPDQPYMRP